MIPGAWEARPRSGTVAAPLASGPRRPADNPGGDGSVPALSGVEGPETQPAELAGWLKVSIFAAALFAAMWLAMAMFF
jgi:hypothetical protein